MDQLNAFARNMILPAALLCLAHNINAQDCQIAGSGIVTPVSSCEAADGAIDITMTGGPSPYYYTWSTGATTQDVSGLVVGDYYVVIYDAVSCGLKLDFTITCEETGNCQGRTQTQGGWGAVPNGGNPGVYLHANFASAFPNGLSIGCTRQLRLTNAQAVTNFLPSGSTPKKLLLPLYTNPTNYANVLAGQLVAATLNVGFDAYDPNFGANTTPLGQMTFVGGTFDGMTVLQLLNEANNFIGNCPSAYTASALNDALTRVNENFDNGTVNNGYLVCTKKNESKIMMVAGAGHDQISVVPNPANDHVTANIVMNSDAQVQVCLYDLAGRAVMQPVTYDMVAGEQRSIRMDLNTVGEGAYLLAIRRGATVSMERIIVAH